MSENITSALKNATSAAPSKRITKEQVESELGNVERMKRVDGLRYNKRDLNDE